MSTQWEQDITGTPNWGLARDMVAQLRELPAAIVEAEIEHRLHNLLEFLFPGLRYPEIATQYQSGDGPIDVYCRNAVFETKRQGRKDDARIKPDGSLETPADQAARYLDALAAPPNTFADAAIGWRAGVTDGKEWSFYDYHRDAPEGAKLTLVNSLHLNTPEDDATLLACLYDFINRTVKATPPTHDVRWAEGLAQPFIDLAARCENSPEYAVKRSLWRGALRGAFLNPQGDAAAERDLFARHTMLVVAARAVAETLRPPELRAPDAPAVRDRLAEGFAAWLPDAGGAAGAAAIDALAREVDRYAWRAANRDTLKDLYHAVIPRQIRHDFGEYYTPDWLARAVCEEVMDRPWRRETIARAVAGKQAGPAVLDPSCGSGTFLYHATQLLLEEAACHPELAGSPPAQVEIVNALVAGIDLHPVAVELSKATKMLAFGELASHYLSVANADTVFLGDSLQWEIGSSRPSLEFGAMVEIPADAPDNPIRLPRSLPLQERFPQMLRRLFDYANRPETPHTEANLLALLNLPNPADREAIVAVYRRFREYIADGRDKVWEWYIANLVQPLRLASQPVSRMVGNPPWVVYNAMDNDCPKCGGRAADSDCEHAPGRQDTFRRHAAARGLWAGAHLATQNDLAATFVATCVDYYLQTGGKFGFALPYAALRARHWEPFRTGDWSRRQDTEQGAHADLSRDAWDFYGVNAPPFPQAHSAAVFGTKAAANRQRPRCKPLVNILAVGGRGVSPRMAWADVKPLLTFNRRAEYPTAPSPAYADAFRNGATLFPQPLVVFERPESRALGRVYFKTNAGKGAWQGKERQGQVEERFVKPALFSRLLLPFGVAGHSHIIAPFAPDGKSLRDGLPDDADAGRFREYWDLADYHLQQYSSGRPPHTLLERIDYQGKLSSQLSNEHPAKVVYQRSGSWLTACTIPAQTIVDGTLNWFAGADENELHYLSAVFNAPALAEFFHDACRYSDRHFQMLPIQNLPIPAYNADNKHHANLAELSQLAHRRVAALVAERRALRRRINRNDVLRDGAMQPILAGIDESVRAILPAFSKLAPGISAPASPPAHPTAEDYLAIAAREFAAGNVQQGADRLWDAAVHTLKSIAQEKSWPIAGAHPDDLYPIVERLAAVDDWEKEVLLSEFSSVRYYPDKVRYGYFDLADGDDAYAKRTVHNFIERVTRLSADHG